MLTILIVGHETSYQLDFACSVMKLEEGCRQKWNLNGTKFPPGKDSALSGFKIS